MSDILRDTMQGFASLDSLITKTTNAHRVKWKGEWYEGPMADAFTELVEAISNTARAALEAAPPLTQLEQAA